MMETNDSIDAMVSKTKSLVAMKRERQERARGYKRIVEESQMLPNLVRLADLMLTEALVAMVQNSMDGLLHVMRHPDPKSKGVLSTTVQFAHELTTFTPDAMRCPASGQVIHTSGGSRSTHTDRSRDRATLPSASSPEKRESKGLGET